jgi:hypothetical protein
MIVSVDPGIRGAAAALCPKRGFVDVIDLPTMPAGNKREINSIEFHNWLRIIKPHRIVIENVHSMPKQGVASTFRFGMAFGTLKATCKAWIGPDLELVDPTVWHAYFQLPGDDKEAARQLALKLFPETSHYLARKKDHNRAESELIAWWAARPPIGRNW